MQQHILDLMGPIPLVPEPAPITVAYIDVRLPAGFPSPCADFTEAPLDLNEFVVRNRTATFYFSVAGDSMIGAGIHDGDKVAVDRSITPRSGHIVVAVVDQNFTLKRLHRRGDVIELRPENPAYQPIRLREGEELQIWGVVTAVIRKLAI